MRKFTNILAILFLLDLSAAFANTGTIGIIQKRDHEANYLTTLESEVVEELNLARTQPQIYAGFLTEYAELYIGSQVHEPGEKVLLTREGKSAVNEAIRFLKKQKPLTPLKPSKGMSRAAKDMVRMQESTSQTGHTGRDGSTFSQRINRYGTWGGSCAENIDYGNNTARKIVMALIIDDGVSSRGHRNSIFTPAFKRVGVACGLHKAFRYMCVMELAQSYTEK